MSECMTQEDAEKMSNEQAVAILKPMMDMMRDQYGCPISDAYFALGKAIEALSAHSDERMLHESCTDCPLYDKDRHSCPRFNKVIPETLRELQSSQPDYTELKQEFLRMASYIDVLLECSDEQKETLNGFISRLSEYMPWTERN